MICFSRASTLPRLVRVSSIRPQAAIPLKLLQRPQLSHTAQSGTSGQDSSERIEEETIPYYSPEYFYPVRVGERLHSRYKVLSKLGYGSNSTVWFCQDLRRKWKRDYVVVKVGTRDSSQATREVEVSNYLATINSSSPFLRPLLDHFDIVGLSGRHQCLVHPVLGVSVDVFQNILPNRHLNEEMVKMIIGCTLNAFDFLHSEANIVYTDLKPDNLIFGLRDSSVLTEYVKFVQENSAPDKIDGDRFIYRSRDLIALQHIGAPVLCDLGEARLKEHPHTGSIMPYQYRAPEVLLGLTWDNKVDIWSIAMLAWHLLFKCPMFVPLGKDNQPSTSVHLAQMAALLGPPPAELLRRSDHSSEYFGQGHMLESHDVPTRHLEDYGGSLDGPNKQQFFDFTRRILRWLPEERPSARELLADPWLQIPLSG